MKFILLNPHLQEAPLLQKLKSLGIVVLSCSDLKEADLILKIHGRTIQLAIGHDDDGIQLNKLIKDSAQLKPIPVILTTSKWTDEQCVQHQMSPLGANGYLRLPVEDAELFHVIDEIIGTELSHGKPVRASNIDSVSIGEGGASIGVKIEDASHVYTKSEADSVMKHASPEEGGIDVDNLFGGIDISVMEQSGRGDGGGAAPGAGDLPQEGVFQQADGSPAEDSGALQIDAAPISFDDPAQSENIPTASPVGEFGDGDALDLGGDLSLGDASSSEESLIDTPLSDDAGGGISLGESTSPAVQKPVSHRASLDEELDDEAMVQMPYLRKQQSRAPMFAQHPVDDAMVPGGAANAPDLETLKKYLGLRELDVAALSQQLRQAKEQIKKLDSELKQEKSTNSELSYLAQEQEHRIKNFDKEKQIALESSSTENQELKFEMKKRMDKIRLLEIQVRDAFAESEKLKDRVRNDIRKIRSREKELENRLEIMKKDSEALLAARENRIIDLKRKLDLLEFNMDILQNQYEKEKQLTAGLRGKLDKAAQVVRVAEGLLDPSEQVDMGDILTQDLDNNPEKDKTTAA